MEPAGKVQELFQEHHQMVLRSAFRLTGNSEDAEDALQTVFFRLLKKDRLQDVSAAYLQRAAVNAALDILRARKVSRRIPLSVVEGGLAAKRADRPDERRSVVELRLWLRDALTKLNPRAAEMFALKFIEGTSNQEIADQFGTTAGTVAVTLHRTRGKLLKEMKSFLGEHP